MNRGTGTGLMVFGLILIVLGAILDFAVTVTTSGFNINTMGLILLIVGIVAFLSGLGVVIASSSGRRTTIREDVHRIPGGQERIVDERDNMVS